MYRVLIIDDESIIADGLYEYFFKHRGDEYDIQKTYSPKEALRILDRMRIDIVITDIKMPGIDGFAVHRAVRENWPETRTVFLTSHSKFDYVYYTTQNQNTYFILKSEGFGEILSLVDQAAFDITKALLDEHIKEGDPAGAAWQARILQNVFLQRLTREAIKEPDIVWGFSLWQLPFDAGQPVYPVLIHRLQPSTTGSVTHLSGYIAQQLEQKFTCYLLHLDDQSALALFQAPDASAFRHVGDWFELVQHALEKLLGERMVIVLPTGPVAWSRLSDCRQALERRCAVFSRENQTVVCSVAATGGTDSQALVTERIDRFIFENYQEPISLVDVAAHVYLSSSYICRLYKQLKGVNVVEQIKRTRLVKSQELLKQTNMKIQDIATAVGFQSARYYINVFRKQTGMSPKEYRDQYSTM